MRRTASAIRSKLLNGKLRGRIQLQHDVGNACGVIAHALQFAGGMHRRDQAAQISRHRLLPGDGHQARLFQLVTALIDDLIGCDHRAGQAAIVIEQRRHRLIDGRVNAIAQPQQIIADDGQFPIECRARGMCRLDHQAAFNKSIIAGYYAAA